MLATVLMGVLGGQRAMTPLAAVSAAAALGVLPGQRASFRRLGHPWVVASAALMAAGEMAADKQRSAPDRTMPVGLAARFCSAAFAGWMLAPRRGGWNGAVLGGTAALASSYPGLRLRRAAMRRRGQIRSGLAEDAVVAAGAAGIVWALSRRRGAGI